MIGGLKQLCIDQSQTILELRGGAGQGGDGGGSDSDGDDGDGDEESVMQPPRGRSGASSSDARRR